MIALPYSTVLPLEPRRLDATDAIGRIRRQDTTPGGAPVLHVAWWAWPLAPVVIWEVIVMPEPGERWRIWIVGDPEQIFFFCTQRGWPYAAHRRDRIDGALPAFEDARP